jgi:hypothetical protein
MPSLIKTTTLLLPLLVPNVSAWSMGFNAEKNCAVSDPTTQYIIGFAGTSMPDEEGTWGKFEHIQHGLWSSITALDWDPECVLEFYTMKDRFDSDTPTITLDHDSRYAHDMGDGQYCLTGFPGSDPGDTQGRLSDWKYNCD